MITFAVSCDTDDRDNGLEGTDCLAGNAMLFDGSG
jgi:hypothetical protein